MDIETLDFSQARIVTPETEGLPTVISEPEQTEPAATQPTEEPAPAVTETTTTPETNTEPTPEPAPEPEPAPSEEPAAAPQPSQDEVFRNVLKEKYGVDTVEEYLAQQAEGKPAYSDTIKKLMEWESKGLKLEDYFRTQSQDFDAMADMDKVRNLMAIENPDMSPEDIDLLIEDEFKINEEDYDEKTVRLGQLKLKQRAKDALPRLKEWQVQAATPPEDKTAALAQAQLQAYHSLVDSQLKDFTSIELPIGEKGETFSVDISADKQGMEAMVKDVNNFFREFVATDAAGNQTYKVREMAEAMYLGKNFRKIAQAIAKQSQSKSVQQLEQEINNASPADPKPAATVQHNTPLSKLGSLASQGLI